jgi:sugar lactone lactonase YvrE
MIGIGERRPKVTDVRIALALGRATATAPAWDAGTNTLLRTDPAGAAHRFWPATGGDERIELPQPAGAVLSRTGGGLACNLRDGIGLRDPDGAQRWLVYWERPGFVAGAAAVDPLGRLWASSVAEDGSGGGWLARVESSGRAKVVCDDLTDGAGIAWSPDGDRLYLADSGRIDVFDVDAEGEPTGRRTVCESAGGLCVDVEGDLWVAIRGAGAIHRFGPDGSAGRVIETPLSELTGCCFGGPELTDLYLTTAATETEDAALLVLPEAGQGALTTRFSG